MSTRIHHGLAAALAGLALLVGATRQSVAQCCRPSFAADEVAAGAAGNAVLRGPWLTAPWRQPLPRLAVFTLGSVVYERFVDHSGWSWSDFNQRLASYALTEAVVGGVQWLRHKARHRPAAGPPLATAVTRDQCAAGSSLQIPVAPDVSTPGGKRMCDLQRRR